MLKITVILIVFAMTSCWNNASQNDEQTRQLTENVQEKVGSQNQRKLEPTLTLRMERFAWTHTLIYRLEVQPTGKVNFTRTNGRFINTKVTGKAEADLEKEKMKQLLTEIETSNFFSLDSAYGYKYKNCQSTMSDSESVKIYVNLNGKEHTIDHDLGCFDVSYEELKHTVDRKERIFPLKLYKLENRIDEIVETNRWIGEQK